MMETEVRNGEVEEKCDSSKYVQIMEKKTNNNVEGQ